MNGMKRPLPHDTERHPTLDTFERVLNKGVIVNRSSGERPRAADPMKPLDFFGADWGGSAHPLFFGETWKTKRDD